MVDAHDVTVRVYRLTEEPKETAVIGYVVRVVDQPDQFLAVSEACRFVNDTLGGLHHLGEAHEVRVMIAEADADMGGMLDGG